MRPEANSTPAARRVRIVFVVASLEAGGAEHGLVRLLNDLDPARFEATLCCVSGGGPLREQLPPHVKVIVLGRASRFDPTLWLRAWRLMRAIRPDIVHMVQFTAGLWSAAPARAAGARTIYSIHGMPDVDRWFVRLFERLAIYPFATRVVSVSRAAATQFEQRYPRLAGRVSVIGNGVDLDRFEDTKSAPAGARRVVAVGRLEPVKGLSTLIEAFAVVVRRLPDVQLQLVGDGSQRAELEAQVAAAGIGDSVTFLGYRKDVPAVLAGASVFVSTSVSECLPNVHLEAMASRLPIVTTRVGGVAEVLDSTTALLVEPKDAASVAAALIRVLEDRALATQLSAAARARVEAEWSSARRTAALTRLFQEVHVADASAGTQPLRVLMAAPQMRIGGAERQIVTLATYLSRQGHSVAVISSGGEFVRDLAAAGIAHHEVPMRKRSLFSLSNITAIRRTVGAGHIDVIHAHSALVALWARLATIGMAVPVVTTGHGWPSSSYPFIGMLLRTSDRVISVSAEMRQRLIDHGVSPSRAVTIPNATEMAQRQPDNRAASRRVFGFESGDVVVGLVGRMMPVKGHDVLLRALAEVQSSCPRIKLLLVGDGPERPALEALASNLRLDGRVIFAGARTDVPALLSAMDIVTLPSRQEGMPVALLEAMAAGRAVIASRVGGIPELVDDGVTGMLVPVEQIGELAAALQRLAADSMLRRAMGEQGRARIARFHTPEIVGLQVLDTYRSALAGRLSS